MARPAKVKTPLGQRLIEARLRVGYRTRTAFAPKIGLDAAAIGFYERGDHEPPLWFLAHYRDRFGINLNWLIADDGEMFGADGSSPGSVRADLLEDALKIVDDWLADNARQINRLKKAEVVSQIYQLIAEEIDQGNGSFDIARVHQHLRLVASR
ncbi:MAG: helix-turn-helix transcriptional regulator [Rhizobiales bacterium]|nr:helix-turn-helix transcriptional regulator [Hyphomicrobiales bacterium]